jgi:NitT/TauT family transport system ATP-binding protein
MTGSLSTPMVCFENVSKRYGNERTILEGVNLTVCRGEFITFIGPSGCGKSTVLKLISGLTFPSNGKISVDGMDPKGARKIISYIFQDATLLPWRTVIQNVALGLELESVPAKRRMEKASELLKLVGLEHVAEAYPRELSGGMKMRVSIARALATNPRLLLMDEPFAALDEMTRERLNEELLRLRVEQKWTAIFVTHSVSEAVFLSTRIVVLAANPARIHAEFPVFLPFPRDTSLRDSVAYDKAVTQVSHALREAIIH